MQSGMSGKPAVNEITLKSWIRQEDLKRAPSLMEDYKNLAAVRPGNPYYDANARRYAAAWKTYWGEYIPQMIATRRVPDGAAWGHYPSFSGTVTSTASQAYNVMVHSFGPGRFKGIVFLCSEAMVREDQGARFGPELTALAHGWKEHFAGQSVAGPGGEDPLFLYTIPNRTLAPKITRPEGIPGRSAAFEIDRWPTAKRGDKEAEAAVHKQLLDLVERMVGEAYGSDKKEGIPTQRQ
jgi:hypothetical protein